MKSVTVGGTRDNPKTIRDLGVVPEPYVSPKIDHPQVEDKYDFFKDAGELVDGLVLVLIVFAVIRILMFGWN